MLLQLFKQVNLTGKDPTCKCKTTHLCLYKGMSHASLLPNKLLINKIQLLLFLLMLVIVLWALWSGNSTCLSKPRVLLRLFRGLMQLRLEFWSRIAFLKLLWALLCCRWGLICWRKELIHKLLAMACFRMGTTLLAAWLPLINKKRVFSKILDKIFENLFFFKNLCLLSTVFRPPTMVALLVSINRFSAIYWQKKIKQMTSSPFPCTPIIHKSLKKTANFLFHKKDLTIVLKIWFLVPNRCLLIISNFPKKTGTLYSPIFIH